MNTSDEIRNQGEAFKRMKGDILDLIDQFGRDFREIIEQYEEEFGRVPTPDDLIWIESEKLGRDITGERNE